MIVTNGKYAGMSKVSNESGLSLLFAVDQRSSLKKMLVADGRANALDQNLDEIKTIVTKMLIPHTSAILFVPPWATRVESPAQ